jgi:paraquat-inducible protein A
MTGAGGRSLRSQFPRRQEIPILLAASAILLPLGLVLPTVTLSTMAGISGSTYSVITGILELARSGDVFLALLIFTFSLVFPILKLTMLIVIWFHGMKPDRREQALHALRVLGKWSMLDVFVVVSLVGAIQFGFLATAAPRIGIYLFSAAILSCMLATSLESRLAHGPERTGRAEGPQSLAALPIALLALLLLGAGLFLPLMETKKLVFWSRDFSVLGAVVDMFRDGRYVLTGIVVLFVILAPLGKLLGQILLLFLRRGGPKQGTLTRTLEIVDKWMMIDVFALGVLVVAVQLGGIADVSPRPGLGCFLAAVFLSASLSWVIKT